jgi:branched-chain amino acid transport system permease protein
MTWQESMGYVMDALSLGSLYALFALSISVVFGVMRLVNFAQGALVAAGAYALAATRGPFALRIVVVLVVCVIAALLMERVAFRPLRDADPDTLLVASFSVSVLLENGILLIFGSAPKGVELPHYFVQQVSLGGLSFPLLDAIAIGLTIVMLLLLVFFLTRTDMGLSIRAAAGDFTMARLMGVRADYVVSIAFGLSGLLAAPAVLIFMGTTGLTVPNVGDIPVLAAFAAVTIGGLGSLTGSLIGGYLFGILTVAFQALLPSGLGSYRDVFVFAIVLALLAVRPQGIVQTEALRTRV